MACPKLQLRIESLHKRRSDTGFVQDLNAWRVDGLVVRKIEGDRVSAVRVRGHALILQDVHACLISQQAIKALFAWPIGFKALEGSGGKEDIGAWVIAVRHFTGEQIKFVSVMLAELHVVKS